jgi:hypothetical protein
LVEFEKLFSFQYGESFDAHNPKYSLLNFKSFLVFNMPQVKTFTWIESAKINYKLLCDVETLLDFPCILPLLEINHVGTIQVCTILTLIYL